jgi:hypothetical protein
MPEKDWLNQAGTNIAAGRDSRPDRMLVPHMSFKQVVLDSNPDGGQFVVRLKVDYRFTDVFGEVHVETAYFAGLAGKDPNAPGGTGWRAKIEPMPLIKDWDKDVMQSEQAAQQGESQAQTT